MHYSSLLTTSLPLHQSTTSSSSIRSRTRSNKKKKKKVLIQMGRGKIEIKRIENTTNRQVTYSKRRQGIMKKAAELTVLCDAKVSIIMLSSTSKHSEYCSPSTDIKQVIDGYQQATGIDLWSSQYERMQNNLKHLKEINHNLRKEISQRIGVDSLDDLNFQELSNLEHSLDSAVKLVRSRKYHVISTQTDTYKKKVRNSHETYKNLLRDLEIKTEQPMYGFMEDPIGYDDGELALANGGSHLYGYHRAQPSQPNLHQVMGFGDLRLA